MKQKNNPFKVVGVYLNLQKKESCILGKKSIETLLDLGFIVALMEGQIEFDHKNIRYYPEDRFFINCDCVISFGGDGTLLYVARQTCFYKIPILGFNLGKLGFLTEAEAGSYKSILTQLSVGNYELEERMMLSCTVRKKGCPEKKYVALNDVLVKSSGSRMIDIEADASGSKIDSFRADGLIISTPTGSTAYSLAAGGPVVSPKAKVMILNPICPHRLHDRSYVLHDEEVIKLKFGNREKEIMVTLDGQTNVPITPDDEVEVVRSQYSTQLIRLNDLGYFDRLRIKLSGGM